MIELVPKALRETVLDLPPVRRIVDTILRDLGIPRETFTYLNYPTRFDCRDTMKSLEGSGIQCPRLDTYAYRLWDYWERNLDPDLFRDRSLAGAVKDKVVVVTGASSGIGRAAAIKLAAAGAKVCLVARTVERLAEVQSDIRKQGGQASVYPVDLTDMKTCDTMLARVREDHGPIDILVNNAGRSIRRSIRQSYDRFHDYERTMQLNYFAAVRLILGVLPSMAERRQGVIINVSSLGVLATPPRFSAYVASKSALDAFSKVLQAEYLDKDISVTTINMPLVRTPMIDPTPFYRYVPAMTPEEAADLICDAIIDKPKRIATRLGIFAQIMTSLLPSLSDAVLNTAYKLFPETAPGKEGPVREEQEPSPEAVIFASIMRGIYW
jgi:short-subunit dehydrogenase